MLWHVAYGGHKDEPGQEVAHDVSEALEHYGWFRVVSAEGEFEAIQAANEEAGDIAHYGEVYFVTPFESKPTRQVEVIV